jgi:hypothetical protein
MVVADMERSNMDIFGGSSIHRFAFLLNISLHYLSHKEKMETKIGPAAHHVRTTSPSGMDEGTTTTGEAATGTPM